MSGGGDFGGNLAPDLNAKVSHGAAKHAALQDVAKALGLAKKPKLLEEPEGTLLISRGRLAWRFEIAVAEPFAERLVDVDAVNGSIVLHWDQLLSFWEPKPVEAIALDGSNVTIGAEVQSDPVPPGEAKTPDPQKLAGAGPRWSVG